MKLIQAIEKIEEKEKEMDLLMRHNSWGAAEGINNQICHIIANIDDIQKDKLDTAIAKNGLTQLATGKNLSVLPALKSLV